MPNRTLPLRTSHAFREGLAELAKKQKEFQKAQGNQAEQAIVERRGRSPRPRPGASSSSEVAGADGKTLRTAMDVIRKKHADAAMLLAAEQRRQSGASRVGPPTLIDQGFKAGDWIKHVAPIVGGGGGGRPDMAQAGGKDPAKLPDALEAATAFADSLAQTEAD